jgi:hypothetical protein
MRNSVVGFASRQRNVATRDTQQPGNNWLEEKRFASRRVLFGRSLR